MQATLWKSLVGRFTRRKSNNVAHGRPSTSPVTKTVVDASSPPADVSADVDASVTEKELVHTPFTKHHLCMLERDESISQFGINKKTAKLRIW
jgi:hypothetical protein